jgi:hypothetical protein
MTAGRRDLERALGLLLSLHIAEVDLVLAVRVEHGGDIRDRRRQLALALEEFQRLAQGVHWQDRDDVANHRRLHRVLARQHQAIIPRGARMQRGRQRALDASHAAVEREFADHQEASQPLAAGETAGGAEQRERDWQIEGGPILAHIGRREIDHDGAIGEGEARIGDGRLDPILGFLHRARRETDGLQNRLSAVADMHFDLDAERVDAVQCRREYTCYQEVNPR